MSINKVWFHRRKDVQFGSIKREILIQGLFSKEKIRRGKRRNFWAWTQFFNFLDIDINYIYVVGKCVTFFYHKTGSKRN